jgi:hypothetical protein
MLTIANAYSRMITPLGIPVTVVWHEPRKPRYGRHAAVPEQIVYGEPASFERAPLSESARWCPTLSEIWRIAFERELKAEIKNRPRRERIFLKPRPAAPFKRT